MEATGCVAYCIKLELGGWMMRPTPVERIEHAAAFAVTAHRELPQKWWSSTNMTRSHRSKGEWRSKAFGIARPPE